MILLCENRFKVNMIMLMISVESLRAAGPGLHGKYYITLAGGDASFLLHRH